MTKHKRKGGQVILETHMFDTFEYHKSEEKRLQDRVDELETGNDLLQGRYNTVIKENEKQRLKIENQQQEIKHLTEELESYKIRDKETKFLLTSIVDFCKECPSEEKAQPIIDMLHKLLRYTGTAENYKLIDSIKTEFRNREKARMGVIYNNPTIYATGSVHEDKSRNMFLDNKIDNLFEELV